MFQIKLSKTCYNNEVQTVGIAGSSIEIVSSFWSDEPQAVTLIDDASIAATTPSRGRREMQHKLRNFVITASSIPRLKQTLQNLEISQWWNHIASFLIIEETSPDDQGCSSAFKILSTAWKMNLLRAKLLCHHESKGLSIYSYNPYTNQAPLPWESVRTYRIKNEHPWTLLVRGYQASQEICKDLDFDKTKDLGGYEIRLSSYSVKYNKNWPNTNLESVRSDNAIRLGYIFRALNASVKIFVESRNNIFNLTKSGVADMSVNAWYQQNNFNTSMTYPYGSSGLVSMTQHRGRLSQIDKLLHVLDKSSRYAVVVVGFVTFVFFKFFLRQSVTSAILNIVRLICNAAVPNLPNNVAMRIYLSGLFVFSVTLQGIYQGQWASLLTKHVNLQNADTLEDLENLNYRIYAQKDLSSYFKISNFSGQFVSLEDFDCWKYVLEDAGAACVREKNYMIVIADKYNLHLSSDYLVKMFLAYMIRENWPVEEKLNTLISRLFEANIFDRVSLKKIGSTVKRIEYNEKEKDKQQFVVMTLKDLAFAFAILGIGLACSTVILVVEIFVQ